MSWPKRRMAKVSKARDTPASNAAGLLCSEKVVLDAMKRKEEAMAGWAKVVLFLEG
ncbi:MAG: hypothetical protein V1784_05610 [bacterium]